MKIDPVSDTAWIVERSFRARDSLPVPVGEEFFIQEGQKNCYLYTDVF